MEETTNKLFLSLNTSSGNKGWSHSDSDQLESFLEDSCFLITDVLGTYLEGQRYHPHPPPLPLPNLMDCLVYMYVDIIYKTKI